MNVSRININGNSYSGNSIVVVNGRVIIDGKDAVLSKDDKIININVEGNIENLKVDVCESLKVSGNANGIQTGSGDVNVGGSVHGHIQTGSGDVECGSVAGSINVGSGDVTCENVGGNVSTMSGDIRNRK